MALKLWHDCCCCCCRGNDCFGRLGDPARLAFRRHGNDQKASGGNHPDLEPIRPAGTGQEPAR